MPGPALGELAGRLQAACLGRGLTVATAESCTGGLVAETITTISGSSGYFLGGVVSYSDGLKASLLGVPAATLKAHGAVSAQVARAMATGCRTKLEVDLAISLTGIAGPDGGSAAKPVGLVYIALVGAHRLDVRRFHFGGDREAVRREATTEALSWLIEAAS